MNEEIKNKIKLISEMLSMYQNTVVKETDVETINLIKRDVSTKKIELEAIKDNLEMELDKLYDNGANEIDPEINQLQIIISDVEDLIEDIIPDILVYTKTSMPQNSAQKEEKIETEPKLNIEVPKNVEVKEVEVTVEKQEKIENKIEEEVEEQEEIENEIEKVVEEQEEIENEIEEEVEEQEEKSNEKDNIKKFKVEEEYKEVAQKPTNFNTIMLKQPTESFRNTATDIVFNRTQNVNSPENAIRKTHNAAEAVMNSIMEKWNKN